MPPRRPFLRRPAPRRLAASAAQGSLLAEESSSLERALRAPRSPPARVAPEPAPEELGATAAVSSTAVVCDPPCTSHGTCVQDPDAAPGVGYCKCSCNFIGETCSRYAPLRLSSVEPTTADFGRPIRVTIGGNHLGEIASLPPPEPDEGPSFRVLTTGGDACTELAVIDDNTVQCTLPPQVPGTTVSFDVKRGCQSAPFAPGAMLKVSGCGDPALLSCGGNQRARADGCGCECLPGWRGQMCNQCAADVACRGLGRSPEDAESDARAAANAVNAAAGGRLRTQRQLRELHWQGFAGRRALAATLDSDATGVAASAANGTSDDGGEAEAAEELTCRMGDFDFYAGTYQKVLSCSMQNLPDGIEPLVISLTCERTSLSGKATCQLLVAPEDEEDRAEIGFEGMLNCVATDCSLDAGEPTGHCEDVSCSFGIYEAAIKAAMPDLKVGGPSNIECKPSPGAKKGGDEHRAADPDTRAQCFVDVDILPFDIMAQCTTSDCVDPALLALDEDGQSSMLAIAIAALAASVCVVALLLLWCARAMRMLPVGADAPAGDGGGAGAHMHLPNDLNQMPRIDRLVFDDVRVRVASGREVVRGASGVAKAGQVYGVIGASGSGKTTLLDAVAGVLSPGATREGRVLVGGHAIPERGVRLPAMVRAVIAACARPAPRRACADADGAAWRQRSGSVCFFLVRCAACARAATGLVVSRGVRASLAGPHL